MSVEEPPLTIPELILRSRKAERWLPPIEKAEVQLRLSGGTDGTYQFAWTILLPRSPDQPALVREAALASGAMIRLMQGKPENTRSLVAAGLLQIRDVSVPRAEAQRLLCESLQLLVPVAGMSRNDGMDGTTYSLSAESGLCSTELVWWQSGPREWERLITWAAAARRHLHELVNPGSPLYG